MKTYIIDERNKVDYTGDSKYLKHEDGQIFPPAPLVYLDLCSPVVTKDVPDYEMWVGNPAKKIRDVEKL